MIVYMSIINIELGLGVHLFGANVLVLVTRLFQVHDALQDVTRDVLIAERKVYDTSCGTWLIFQSALEVIVFVLVDV